MVISMYCTTYVENFIDIFIDDIEFVLGEKVHFIKRHLGIMSSFNPQEERQQAREFVLNYLKDDGVFLTRLLSINSSDLVVTEIINQLWIRYKTANRLYATVNPQRHIQTTQIINNEIIIIIIIIITITTIRVQ